MSNIIKLADLVSAPKNDTGHIGTVKSKGRKATKQGALVKIWSTESPKPHTGGGRRGPQQGHSKRSEKRVFNYLCTCHPSDYFITLTFPLQVGPAEAKGAMKNFLRNLENRLPFKPGAVAKLELQPARMSAEFMLFLWVKEGYRLEEELVQELWDKVAGPQSQIKFEETDPNRWLKASDYASKKISVSDDCVTVGSKNFPVRLNDGGIFGAADGDTLLLGTNPQYRTKLSITDIEVVIDKNMFDAWRLYTGQYVMKKNTSSIPKYPKETGYISHEMVNKIRYQVNAKRKVNFVGKNQYLSVAVDDRVGNTPSSDLDPSNDIILSGGATDTDSNDFNFNVTAFSANDFSEVNTFDNHSCTTEEYSVKNRVLRYFQSVCSAVMSCCRKTLQKIRALRKMIL